ncbi:MAG: cytochrome c family protein [Herbaspirillum sp.]|nr:cytochrome c family protein [Herbaspirillum sp.]
MQKKIAASVAASLTVSVLASIAAALLFWSCVTPTTPAIPRAPGADALADTPTTLTDPQLIKHGEYLAIAGDCIACHSTGHGQPFAGGLPMKIPSVGTIYSSNITPDPQTGIGDWTLEDFDRAVRQGISKDGHHLYPAMPYPSYAKISNDDVKALYAYFEHGVAPVLRAQQADTTPLKTRRLLTLWNGLFLDKTPYQTKTDQSVAWNRGAYLAQGLAHCGSCHTPRGLALQERALDESRKGFLSGSSVNGWDGYNITADLDSGIGRWTQAQLVQYLRSGSVPGLAQAAGTMGEAIQHSFSQMSAADIDAIATYIRTVPAVSDGSRQPRHSWGNPASDAARLRGIALNATTVTLDPARLYLGNCASCHQAQGQGTADGYYPSLLHNSTVGASKPDNLVQVILHGVHRVTPDNDAGMPAFAAVLSDAQIAALSNYITAQFGNPAVITSAEQVAKLRD